MDRARVICHMMTSIDGSIQGGLGEHPDVVHASNIYEKLNYSYGQAIGIGRGTVDSGARPDLSGYAGADVEYRDSVRRDECTYGVIFDRKGRMYWEGKYQQYPDMPRRRIIEVLTEQAAPEYLKWLNEREIPYMFAGRDDLDLELVLKKLLNDYGVSTMVLGGGATLNAAFLAAGLVDELSLVVAPGISGRGRALGISAAQDAAPIARYFVLRSAEHVGHNVLLLRYAGRE